MIVENEEQRQALAALDEQTLKARPAEVGDLVELPPCVPVEMLPAFEAKGRPCPRVELEADNVEPLELFQILINESARPTAETFMSASWGELGQDRRLALLRRTLRALRDPDVTALLYPKLDE